MNINADAALYTPNYRSASGCIISFEPCPVERTRNALRNVIEQAVNGYGAPYRRIGRKPVNIQRLNDTDKAIAIADLRFRLAELG